MPDLSAGIYRFQEPVMTELISTTPDPATSFDVAERTIALDYNERPMESDYSQHVF
jgi:hypothetical protein